MVLHETYACGGFPSVPDLFPSDLATPLKGVDGNKAIEVIGRRIFASRIPTVMSQRKIHLGITIRPPQWLSRG